MSSEYTNARGESYFLHEIQAEVSPQGTRSQGRYYYWSTERDNDAVERIPDDYNLTEGSKGYPLLLPEVLMQRFYILDNNKLGQIEDVQYPRKPWSLPSIRPRAIGLLDIVLVMHLPGSLAGTSSLLITDPNAPREVKIDLPQVGAPVVVRDHKGNLYALYHVRPPFDPRSYRYRWSKEIADGIVLESELPLAFQAYLSRNDRPLVVHKSWLSDEEGLAAREGNLERDQNPGELFRLPEAT